MFSKILKISQQNLGSQKSLLLQAIFLTAAAILVNGLVTGLSELWFSLPGQLVFALGYGFTQGAYFSSQLVKSVTSRSWEFPFPGILNFF